MQATEPPVHKDVGYLDMYEYNRFVWALSKAEEVMGRIGDGGSGSELGMRVDGSSDPAIPLSSAYLLVDEIESHLRELSSFRETTHAANDIEGHMHAITLGKLITMADRRWPERERPHTVTVMTCGGCDQLTLTYRPPRFAGDKIVVDCLCGYKLTEAEFALVTLIIENDWKAGVYDQPATERNDA